MHHASHVLLDVACCWKKLAGWLAAGCWLADVISGCLRGCSLAGSGFLDDDSLLERAMIPQIRIAIAKSNYRLL